jgi:hypothetical protein
MISLKGNPDAKWEARFNVNVGYYFRVYIYNGGFQTLKKLNYIKTNCFMAKKIIRSDERKSILIDVNVPVFSSQRLSSSS